MAINSITSKIGSAPLTDIVKSSVTNTTTKTIATPKKVTTSSSTPTRPSTESFTSRIGTAPINTLLRDTVTKTPTRTVSIPPTARTTSVPSSPPSMPTVPLILRGTPAGTGMQRLIDEARVAPPRPPREEIRPPMISRPTARRVVRPPTTPSSVRPRPTVELSGVRTISPSVPYGASPEKTEPFVGPVVTEEARKNIELNKKLKDYEKTTPREITTIQDKYESFDIPVTYGSLGNLNVIYTRVADDLAQGNITEDEAVILLNKAVDRELKKVPKSYAENWIKSNQTFLDSEGNEVSWKELQASEPALVGINYNQKTGEIDFDFDYSSAQRKEMQELWRKSPAGAVGKGALDVITQFPRALTTGAGYLYRSAIGEKQPSYQKQLFEGISEGSYGISQAMRKQDLPSYLSKTVGLESPAMTDVYLPVLTGGALAYAGPSIGAGATRLGAWGVSRSSLLSRVGGGLARVGAWSARHPTVSKWGARSLTGGLFYAPAVPTAYGEYVSGTLPKGATAEELARSTLRLGSFYTGTGATALRQPKTGETRTLRDVGEARATQRMTDLGYVRDASGKWVPDPYGFRETSPETLEFIRGTAQGVPSSQYGQIMKQGEITIGRGTKGLHELTPYQKQLWARSWQTYAQPRIAGSRFFNFRAGMTPSGALTGKVSKTTTPTSVGKGKTIQLKERVTYTEPTPVSEDILESGRVAGWEPNIQDIEMYQSIGYPEGTLGKRWESLLPDYSESVIKTSMKYKPQPYYVGKAKQKLLSNYGLTFRDEPAIWLRQPVKYVEGDIAYQPNLQKAKEIERGLMEPFRSYEPTSPGRQSRITEWVKETPKEVQTEVLSEPYKTSVSKDLVRKGVGKRDYRFRGIRRYGRRPVSRRSVTEGSYKTGVKGRRDYRRRPSKIEEVKESMEPYKRAETGRSERYELIKKEGTEPVLVKTTERTTLGRPLKFTNLKPKTDIIRSSRDTARQEYILEKPETTTKTVTRSTRPTVPRVKKVTQISNARRTLKSLKNLKLENYSNKELRDLKSVIEKEIKVIKGLRRINRTDKQLLSIHRKILIDINNRLNIQQPKTYQETYYGPAKIVKSDTTGEPIFVTGREGKTYFGESLYDVPSDVSDYWQGRTPSPVRGTYVRPRASTDISGRTARTELTPEAQGETKIGAGLTGFKPETTQIDATKPKYDVGYLPSTVQDTETDIGYDYDQDTDDILGLDERELPPPDYLTSGGRFIDEGTKKPKATPTTSPLGFPGVFPGAGGAGGGTPPYNWKQYGYKERTHNVPNILGATSRATYTAKTRKPSFFRLNK